MRRCRSAAPRDAGTLLTSAQVYVHKDGALLLPVEGEHGSRGRGAHAYRCYHAVLCSALIWLVWLPLRSLHRWRSANTPPSAKVGMDR